MGQLIRQEVRVTPISSLRHHPKNPKKGDVEAIAESIRANGFYGTVVAQESTGYVLAGNHRIHAARAVGLEAVPVAWIDCDDATALRILAADNRTSDLGGYDQTALADLLSEISNAEGLEGTGYDETDLEALIQSLIPPEEPKPKEEKTKGEGKGERVGADGGTCKCPECGHEFFPED